MFEKEMYFEPPRFNYERCMGRARKPFILKCVSVCWADMASDESRRRARPSPTWLPHLHVFVWWFACEWIMSSLEEGRGPTCSHFAHQIYCVYIAVTAKSHAKMIQNTATICFIACKILTLKSKYLVLFIKRLWAGSAYRKSAQKSTLREIHYFFNSIAEFGVQAVTMCHVGIDSTCRILFPTKVLCWRCQAVWDCWDAATRPTSSQRETRLFPPPNYWLYKIDTNSHNPSLSSVIPYFFFCTGIDSINLIFVFSYIIPLLYVSILVGILHGRLFYTSQYVKSTFFQSWTTPSIKVTKYAMLNTKTLCGEGLFPSPLLVSMANGLFFFTSPECSFCDVCRCQCCLYLWKDTMFSEN